MTEPYTKEEMREMFLEHCSNMAHYWSTREGCSTREMCDGLVFSILNIIDGMSGGFPCAINLAMSPHPEDKEYHIAEGEQWIEAGQVINDDVTLHELYCMEKNGKS